MTYTSMHTPTNTYPFKHKSSRDLSRLTYREGASPTEKKLIIPTTLDLSQEQTKTQNGPKGIVHEELYHPKESKLQIRQNIYNQSLNKYRVTK